MANLAKEALKEIQNKREEQLSSLRQNVFNYKKRAERAEQSISLAIICLEDGAIDTAKRILRGER